MILASSALGPCAWSGVFAQTASAVLDDGVLEAGVDPALGDGRVGLLGLVEEPDSDGVLGQVGGGHGHGEDESDRVGEDARFLPTIFLAASVPWSGFR